MRFAFCGMVSKYMASTHRGVPPKAWSPELFAARAQMPQQGWDAVTVPGCVSAWAEVSERFGVLPFEALFEPAIHYARNGFVVSPYYGT